MKGVIFMTNLNDEARALEVRLLRASSPEAQARIKAVSAIHILKAFSRGIFNQNNMMEIKFAENFLEKKPIQIVGFWGAGDKKSPDKADYLLLDEYRIIRDVIASVTQSSVEIILLMADIHGKFNGYNGFEGYHSSIDIEAKRRGFNPLPLGRLYEEWGIRLPDSGTPINEGLWKKFSDLRQSDQLIESAKKHNRQDVPVERAAFDYWLMRNNEAQPLYNSFPRAVLFVNGSRDMAMVTLPKNMPHIYSRFGPVWF